MRRYRFSFIPKNEFWIDREYGPGEEQFFIDHLLIENRLMAGGLGYDKALKKADAVETGERRKTERKKFRVDNRPPAHPRPEDLIPAKLQPLPGGGRAGSG